MVFEQLEKCKQRSSYQNPGFGKYVRCTFVACSHKMKRLVVCGTDFFVNAETCFLGSRSKSVSEHNFCISGFVTYDDSTVAQVPHLCSSPSSSVLLSVYCDRVQPIVTYLIRDCDPINLHISK